MVVSVVGLRVLCAGATAEERERVEALVRSAVGPVPERETWLVSLVRTRTRWCVTLDGPGQGDRGSHATATDGNLREAIFGLLRRPLPESPPAAVAADGPCEHRRDAQRCRACGRAFEIMYDALPGERRERVPVACPHCWEVDHFEVAESAALERSYTTDRR
jgi:hypothetical protein